MKSIIFKMANEPYCIEMSKVREIMKYDNNLTKINSKQNNLKGIINVRGEVLSVYDARELANVSKDCEPSKLLIVEEDEIAKAYLVDDVIGVDNVSIETSTNDMLNNKVGKIIKNNQEQLVINATEFL